MKKFITTTILIGTHDLGTFPAILLAIKHNGTYDIPNGPRTYTEVSHEEWYNNPMNLERRSIDQTEQEENA